jgi:hypothetical protein
MEPESWGNSLLGNGLVNTFPWKQTCATVEKLCFLWLVPRSLQCNGAVNISAALNQHATIEETVVSVGSAPRPYNEDLRQLRKRIKSPELAVGRIIEKKWQQRN